MLNLPLRKVEKREISLFQHSKVNWYEIFMSNIFFLVLKMADLSAYNFIGQSVNLQKDFLKFKFKFSLMVC